MGKYKVQVYSMLHPVENRLVFSGAILELEEETALPYVGSGYLYPEQEVTDENTEGQTEGQTEAPSELFTAMTETVVDPAIAPVAQKEKKK